MANLVISGTAVLPGSGAGNVITDGTFGQTVIAGKYCYKDPNSGNLYYMAGPTWSGGMYSSLASAVSLTGGSIGQPGKFMRKGNLTVNSGVANGETYALNASGGIGPIGDQVSGNYVNIIGRGTSDPTNLRVIEPYIIPLQRSTDIT